MPYSVEDIASHYGNFAIHPIMVDLSSRSQKTLSATAAVNISVAPDGKHALIQSQKTPGLTLYDLANGNTLYTTPYSSTKPVWTDAAHYTYAIESDVWQAAIDTHSADLVSTLPTSLPSSITYDQTAHTYYVSYYANDADAGIIKLGVEQ
jgi:hypothetical protein